MRILFYLIVCIVSLITLFVYASEEEIFQDERHSDTEVPDVSLEKIPERIGKTTKASPHMGCELKVHHLPTCCVCAYSHRHLFHQTNSVEYHKKC